MSTLVDDARNESDRLMSQALLLHQQGKLAEAGLLYRQVLAATPRHAEALHMLGVVALQQRRFDEADRLIAQSLEIRPDNAEALNNRAGVLRALQRFGEALKSYDEALSVRPDLAQAQNNRGNVLRDLGRPEEALASYNAALDIRPGYAEAHFNRGNALRDLARLEEALASYDAALAVRSDYPEALNNRGNALHQLGRLREALASYDRALELKPEYVEALKNRDSTLDRLRVDEVLATCDAMLSVNPNDAEALKNRGDALLRLRRFEEAMASYDRALAIRPDYAEAQHYRAHVLYQLWRPEDALTSCDKVLAVTPDHAEGLNNRGVSLQALGQFDEALESYAAALAVKPDFALAHWNEALCRLSLGDFATGWEKYEWRWRLTSVGDAKRDYAAPLWLGQEDLSGKTILLHAEQGLGDTLQFCRYAPAVAAKGATVILLVPAPLRPLLRTLAGVAEVTTEPPATFDFHCPLLSLPLAFGTRLETIPAPVPYLSADPSRAAGWRERLAMLDGIKVGLVWAGSARLDNTAALLTDRRRSMRLQQMWPFGAIEGVTLVSLQKGEPAAQTRTPPPGLAIHDWTHELADFADTAALVAALDLVITVDTAVAHLAGALGKPVWVLNRNDRCWRWLRGREDTPWYPTMRLFTQPGARDWASVVSQVSKELRKFAGSRKALPASDGAGLAPMNMSDNAPKRAAEPVASIACGNSRYAK